MNREINDYLEFGKFRLDARNKVLWFDNAPVDLPLKEIDLLCTLTEKGGDLVTKNELLDRVWKDEFVEESNLSRHIYLLRKMFKDFGEEDELIQTVPRRGYRFTGEIKPFRNDLIIERHIFEETVIEALDDDGSKPEVQQDLSTNASHLAFPGHSRSSHRLLRPLTVAAICLAVLVGIWGLWWMGRARSNQDVAGISSIAVLPLRSFGVSDDESLRLRITDALITELASRSTNFSVRPTSSVLPFSQSEKGALDIGQSLEVDAVLDGHLQQEGDRIRVTLQLLSVKTGEQLWSQQFDGREGQILVLQDAIAAQLYQKLGFGKAYDAGNRPTSSSEAYENYLKGRFFWNKRTDEDLRKSIGYFEAAISLDPSFALAHAGLADVYCVLPEYSDFPEKESYDRAQSSAGHALAIDNDLAEALTSLAFVEFWNNKNFGDSEKNFRRAIAADPNYPTAHHWFANVLIANKDLREAEKQMSEAQKLDPMSLVINTELGNLYYYSRQNEAAARQFRRSLEIDPNFYRATFCLGRLLTTQGKYAEAMALYNGLDAKVLHLDGAVAEIALTKALSGDRTDAEKRLNELNSRSKTEKTAFSSAIVYLGLGRRDDAVASLEKAAIERESDLAFINVDPIFDPLRDNAEFVRLAARYP